MQEKYKCHCGKIIGKKGGRYEYVKHFIGCGQFLELWGKEYTLMRKIVGKLRSGYNVEELKKWLRKYFIEVFGEFKKESLTRINKRIKKENLKHSRPVTAQDWTKADERNYQFDCNVSFECFDDASRAADRREENKQKFDDYQSEKTKKKGVAFEEASKNHKQSKVTNRDIQAIDHLQDQLDSNSGQPNIGPDTYGKINQGLYEKFEKDMVVIKKYDANPERF